MISPVVRLVRETRPPAFYKNIEHFIQRVRASQSTRRIYSIVLLLPSTLWLRRGLSEVWMSDDYSKLCEILAGLMYPYWVEF